MAYLAKITMSEILNQMCEKELSDSDIKIICKNRGFGPNECSSRKFFENFLISEIGLKEAFSNLSQDEIIGLHLMSFLSKPVNISFFDRIYTSEKNDFLRHKSFTQKYQPIFKQIKNSLILNGIILFADVEYPFVKKTKLEKFSFYFPEIFRKFLPTPFKIRKDISLEYNKNESSVRNKLKEIIANKDTKKALQKFDINLSSEGSLLIGDKNFKLSYLEEWQKEKWLNSILTHQNLENSKALSPIKAINYAMSLLSKDEWVSSTELSNLLNIFCYEFGKLDVQKICENGWKWGRLLKNISSNEYYYRPVQDNSTDNVSCYNYLEIYRKDAVIVDLDTIPLNKIEILSNISKFKIHADRIYAFPSFVKIGKVYNSICDDPMFIWLKNNVESFNKIIHKVGSCFGKKIIHKNLLIARVKDLSLNVSLKKALSDYNQILFIENGFIVFPKDLLKRIENFVNNAGYVIKKVESK
ncbi:MAG: hypothetical protein HQK79_13455 [Desulfobacterales bacterium]|nr:hypothetical protein [Desulfobacterales bacterium]MBF0395980.1 hypothetical protein [Desulfobacterales bacterium]